MTNIGNLFLVEGLDLAGKTSACKSLVARLQPRPEYRRNAFAERNALYLAADDLRRTDGLDSRHLGHAYLAAAALDVALFRPPRKARIQESTIALRSLCLYRARGEDDLADGFNRLLDHKSFPQVEATVVLTASLDVRRARLEMRRRESPDEIAPDDLAVIRTPDLFLRMEDILIDECVRRFRAKIVDTSALGKDEVVDALATAFAGSAG